MANNKDDLKKSTGKHLSPKGLDKIFGEHGSNINNLLNEIESSPEAKSSSEEISIADIRPNPYQPRKYFNREEIAELGASLKQHGLIQPIVVKKSINGYQLIAGERRLKAAKQIGWEKIPALMLNFSDDQMMEVALIENIQRSNLTAIEEALAYKTLMGRLSLTQEQLAERVGKSRSQITNTLRLLVLPKVVQDLVLQGTLTMGQVRPLVAIVNKPKIMDQIVKKILSEKLNAREIEALVKTMQDKPDFKVRLNLKQPDRDLVYVENLMMKRLGTKVKISRSKISISYTNTKDLNRILALLNMIENN